MKKQRYSINFMGRFFCILILTFFSLQSAAYSEPSSYYDTVQKIYIGYYQRPADPAGLVYWAERLDDSSGNLNEIIEAFASSEESQALYGAITGSNIAAVVNDIYQALFGRDAEVAGRDWYVSEFNKGNFTAATIMLNVLYGAQGTDLQSVSNKLAASNYFTLTIDPELDGANYQTTYAGEGDAITGRNFLALYATSTHVPTQAETAAFIRANISDPGDALAPTYSISGTVNSGGAPCAGATAALTGAGTATTSTNAAGQYSFTDLAAGSYTITVTKAGYAVTPATLNVTIASANVAAQDFTLAEAIPVILVHGSGGAASNYSKFYEYFTGMGFPGDEIFMAVMPRIDSCTSSNTQSACNGMTRAQRQQWAIYTPKTGETYSRTAWSGQGNTVYNVPALNGLITSVLSQTGASAVNLVGQGNGTYIIREFLTSASYATNRAKVKKAVFIAGAADIESNNSSNRIYTYLKDVASNLPSGIDYYAVTSNADYVRVALKSYAADTIFNTALYPGAENYSDADGLYGYDAIMVTSRELPVKKMYTWLTGNAADPPADKSAVDIGGMITDKGVTTDYLQTPVVGAAVKISYYNNTTGAVTQADVCSTTSGADGKWSCSGLNAAEFFKISVSFNSKTSNFFLAERIRQNNKVLVLNIPSQGAKTAGQIFVGVVSAAEFFSDHLYPDGDMNGKPATVLTAAITNGSAITYNMTTNTVTSSNPSEYRNTNFLNWTGTATNTTSGGYLYNFGGSYSDFAGQTVAFTSTLNAKSATIQFDGDDFTSAIVPYILYLY